MKSTIISLMQHALRTLSMQWSIDIDHLEMCKSFFNRYEMLLNHEVEGIEEEHEDDGTDYTCKITLRHSDGYDEYLSATLSYYYPNPSIRLHHFIKVSRYEKRKIFYWSLNFNENKQLYFIGVDDYSTFEHSKRLWAYKYNKRFD